METSVNIYCTSGRHVLD